MKESPIFKLIMLGVSAVGTILFRNNVALAAAGKIEWIKRPMRVVVGPGDAVVRNARPLHAGLCEGSSDGIGWTPMVITQEMVGRTVAVFTAIEAKTATGRATPEQLNFCDQVRQAGGIAGIARSADEAVALVQGGFGA